MTDVVQKLWGFCHTLRHDGIDYGDYIEQITYLLFLKMADEKNVKLPEGCRWPNLKERSGTELTDGYLDVLRTLGKQPGILGDIYAGAQSRFNNPVNLKKLVSLIDDASRLVAHSAFCLGETALDIEGVLKQALLRRGCPIKLVVDNGAAYRAHTLQGICARLGIHLIFCRPYAPEGKECVA